MRQQSLFALLMMAAAPARGEQTVPPQASAYREVMQAQYAAQGTPLPARPEEAQRIYESYLRSLGQAPGGQPARAQSRDGSTNSGSDAGTNAH